MLKTSIKITICTFIAVVGVVFLGAGIQQILNARSLATAKSLNWPQVEFRPTTVNPVDCRSATMHTPGYCYYDVRAEITKAPMYVTSKYLVLHHDGAMAKEYVYHKDDGTLYSLYVNPKLMKVSGDILESDGEVSSNTKTKLPYYVDPLVTSTHGIYTTIVGGVAAAFGVFGVVRVARTIRKRS